jgi:hypothetical protein
MTTVDGNDAHYLFRMCRGSRNTSREMKINYRSRRVWSTISHAIELSSSMGGLYTNAQAIRATLAVTHCYDII